MFDENLFKINLKMYGYFKYHGTCTMLKMIINTYQIISDIINMLTIMYTNRSRNIIDATSLLFWNTCTLLFMSIIS